MEKLSRMRVSPEWAVALTACLDGSPPVHSSRWGWVVAIGLALVGAGCAGIYLYF
jgi:hypothetical protein